MIGTLEFLRESFNRFNSEIFGNNLPVPILKISNARTFLGKFQHKKQPYSKGILNEFIVILSNAFDVPQEVLEDTIIHEMVHYEIAFLSIKDTSAHGNAFLSRMNEINVKYGRNLAVSQSIGKIGGVCLKPKAQRSPESMVAVLELKTEETFFKVMPLTITGFHSFCDKIERVPSVKSESFYGTFSEHFRKYPRSTSLKVYKMTDEVAKELGKATLIRKIEK